jgi:hypothetical protein
MDMKAKYKSKVGKIKKEILLCLRDGNVKKRGEIMCYLRSRGLFNAVQKYESQTRNDVIGKQQVYDSLAPSKDSSLIGQRLVEKWGNGQYRITKSGAAELTKIDRAKLSESRIRLNDSQNISIKVPTRMINLKIPQAKK